MTTVKASCHVCGDIELVPSQLRLVVCSQADRSYYSFTCTTCGDEVRKPADEEVQALLRSGGVPEELWIIPAEALELHTGPAISVDEVLDFVLSLDRIDIEASALR